MPGPDYAPIEDYGAIGDCHTAALISRWGSIDWYCPGRFDAAPVFWRVLDAQRGGYFQVLPAGAKEAWRRYLPDTNILETTIGCEHGRLKLTDFMPIHRRQSHRLGHDVGTTHRIFRLLEAEEGACSAELRFKAVFNFGQTETSLTMADGKGAVARAEGQCLALHSGKAQLKPAADGEVRGTIELEPGERTWLVLSFVSGEAAASNALAPDVSIRDLRRTAEYWETWATCCRYQGRYREQVVRSALTLKLLTYEPSGAAVAAPTTSLPELIGGIRNWDYRFTWLRDASLSVYALGNLGYMEEGSDFIEFLVGACKGDPSAKPQIMYRIDGSPEIEESVLADLDGYKGSRPVRIGNGAYKQQQLDIYGNVLAAAYHFHRRVENAPETPDPAPSQRLSRRNWGLLCRLADQAAQDWQ
ncbi:MAG TPA: glycoside hydrolase family 15 protein, partial [Chloroflexota bacterium]|nr:glycoside hydrolase family 15 protein [Chloroflexota bacterium]